MLQRLHLAASPGRSRFALALGAQTVRLWEVDLQRRMDDLHEGIPEDGYGLDLDTRSGGLLGLCFVADGVLLSVHAEGLVRAWRIERHGELAGADADPYAGWMHEVSGADEPLITGGWSQMPPGTQRQQGASLQASLLWELKVGAKLACCELQHELSSWQQVRGALGGANGELFLLDVFARRAPELRLLGQLKSPIVRVALTEDGSCLASAARDRTIAVWQLQDVGPDERVAGPWRMFEGSEGEIWAMSFSRSGRYLVSGGIDNGIYFWDLLAKNALRAVSHDHRGWVGSLAWSDDDHVVASASWDNTVGLFRAGDLMPLYCFEHHRDYAAQVIFIPDTSWLVSASYDRTLAVWDWHHAEQVTTFEGHTDWVQSVQWLGNGQLVSASSDRTLRLWSINSLRCLRVLGDESAQPLDLSGLGGGLSEVSMGSMARRSGASSSRGSGFPVYRSSGFGEQRVRGVAAQPVPQQVREAVEAAQTGLDQEVSMVVEDAAMLSSLLSRGPRRAAISPEELAAELSTPREAAREGRGEGFKVGELGRERQDTGSQRWRVWVEEQPGAAPAEPPARGDSTQVPMLGGQGSFASQGPELEIEESASSPLSRSLVTEESGLLIAATALRFQEMPVDTISTVMDGEVEELGAAKSYELESIELGQRVPSSPIWDEEPPSMALPNAPLGLVASQREEEDEPPPLFDLPDDEGPNNGKLRLVAYGAPEQGLHVSLAPIPAWGDDRSGLLPLTPPSPVRAPTSSLRTVSPEEPEAPVAEQIMAAQAPEPSAPISADEADPAPEPEPPAAPAALHSSSMLSSTSWAWDDSEPAEVAAAPVKPALPALAPPAAARPSLQLDSVKAKLRGKLRQQEQAREPEPVEPAPADLGEREASALASLSSLLFSPTPVEPAPAPEPDLWDMGETPAASASSAPIEQPPAPAGPSEPSAGPVLELWGLGDEALAAPLPSEPSQPSEPAAVEEPPAALEATPDAVSRTAEFPIVLPAEALPPAPEMPSTMLEPGASWQPWGDEPSEAIRISSSRTTSEDDAVKPEPQPAPPTLDFASLEEGTSVGPGAFASHPMMDLLAPEVSEPLPMQRAARVDPGAFSPESQQTRQKTAPGGHKVAGGATMFGAPLLTRHVEPDPIEVVDLLTEQTSASYEDMARGGMQVGDVAVAPAPRVAAPRVEELRAPGVIETSVEQLWAGCVEQSRPAMMIMKRRGAQAPAADWRSWDRLKTALSCVLTLAADEDKRLLVIGGRSRDVIAYNAQMERLWDVHTHGSLVQAALLIGGGRVLVAGGDDALLHLWALSAIEQEPPTHHAILDGHAGPITRLVAGPSGKVLLSGSEDGTARLWSLEDGRSIATLSHEGPVRAMAFGTRGPITADETPGVRIWDNRGIQLDMLEGFPAMVTALACYKTALYVGCADGSVFLCTSGKREALTTRHRGAVRHIQLLPGGDLLAITGGAGLLQLLTPGEISPVQVLDLGEALEQASALGPSLVVGTSSGALEQLRRR